MLEFRTVDTDGATSFPRTGRGPSTGTADDDLVTAVADLLSTAADQHEAAGRSALALSHRSRVAALLASAVEPASPTSGARRN